MKKLARLVPLSLLLLVGHGSRVHAQSEADAIGSAASPAASTPSVRRAAPKFADASIGLEFEYKVDNADVCVAWPEQLQDAGCEGMDVHKIAAYATAHNGADGPSLRSMAVLRYNNSSAVISILHTPNTKTTVSQGDIDEYVKGVLEGFRGKMPGTWTMSGSTPGSLYDVMEINDIDALRFEVTSDVPRGDPAYAMSRVVGYMLFGKHGQVAMMAMTDPHHLSQTREAITSIVKTMHMPRLAQRGFGKSAAFARWWDSAIAPFVLVLVVAGLFSVQSYFLRRKRKMRSR